MSMAAPSSSAPPGDPLLERFPLVVRHDEIELPVGCLVDLVDRANVGAVQRRGRFGFLQEPLLGRVIPGQVGREEFDRNGSIQAGILRLIHNPALKEATVVPRRQTDGPVV